MSEALQQQVQRWKQNPVAFVREVLLDPETGKPFYLYAEEEEFVRRGFTLTSDGRLPFPELIFSAPKKSGKTALAACCAIYVIVVLAGKFGEGYSLANDFDQSQGRVFQSITRIIEASPLLRDSATSTKSQTTFSTGSTIQALASDYAGSAGSNPNISVFDELWAYVSEKSHRLWDEMVPVPTRRVSVRLTVTYAGFEGESDLLETLYKRGMQGNLVAPDLYEIPGELLMFWTHRPCAPWQTEAWLQQMRGQLRPHAYLRLIENRWVTSESEFIDMSWWDACVDQEARPLVSDCAMSVWVGVDASTKKDSTAVLAATWDRGAKKARLVSHRIFTPTKQQPIDFEVVEDAVIDLHKRFNVRECRFDPYQMVSSAQRLTQAGVRMIEFPQTSGNLTEASQTLYDAIKSRNLIAYPDADIRLAVNRAVAVESPRGWRISKEKASHKIDVVVAMAQAVLGAIKDGSVERQVWLWAPSERTQPDIYAESRALQDARQLY